MIGRINFQRTHYFITYQTYRLTAAGYVCYLRSIHRIIDERHRLPWRDELLKMSPQLLSVYVLLVFLTVVLLKAYAIGIVRMIKKIFSKNICKKYGYNQFVESIRFGGVTNT